MLSARPHHTRSSHGHGRLPLHDVSRRIRRRRGWDAAIRTHRPYGTRWSGPIFVLTHHADTQPADAGVTNVDEISLDLRQARAAAGAKNVEIFSPGTWKQALERGLLDAFNLHIAPLLLGDGIRLYDAPGGATVELRRPDRGDALEQGLEVSGTPDDGMHWGHLLARAHWTPPGSGAER